MAFGSDRVRRYLAGGCVSGLGAVLLLVPLYDIWDDLRNLSWDVTWTLLENSALLVLAFGLIVAGVWLVRLDWETDYVVTVAKWNLLVGGAIAALFLWIVLIQLRVMSEPKPYVLALNGVLFGVVAAFGIGVYNANQQRYTDKLEAQERRLLELCERVSASERRYRTLAERFPDGIVALFDEELTFSLSAGEGFDRVPLGPGDVDGRTPSEGFGEAFAETVTPALRRALDGDRETVELEYADRHWLVRTIPIEDDDETIVAGMLMAQDITDLIDYQRELEASNERLEQFASAVSHDLQEPLRMVTSYLELLEGRYGDELDEDGREFLDYAVNGADRMGEMIDGLLEYARVETRGESFEPVDLNAVVADVREDLQVKLDESDADLTVEDLPRVTGDRSQLRRVFQNLLENALEYSGDDPPRVHVGAEPAADGGAGWIVSVRDEGIGLDPEHADRIFDLFERLHAKADHQGTGIGLALCERIVDRHGGEIWVDSEPGEGTTFYVELPAASADRREIDSDGANTSDGGDTVAQ
ncbi:sensor histidine kinase [Halopiger aswanensis]|uniref:histidine kinase n=1 Tax=Halopiger aswanensis TaxID=148449 RepID=A0A419WJL1_9EURY|nr:ATP-binding protein [Halopiger aswanensis]RKD95675.1 PAS domain-containing protein [Halopiger aswanensis]